MWFAEEYCKVFLLPCGSFQKHQYITNLLTHTWYTALTCPLRLARYLEREREGRGEGKGEGEGRRKRERRKGYTGQHCTAVDTTCSYS